MNKKLLCVAIAGAMAAPTAAHAVKYSISGQVNRAVVFQDDGVQSDVRNVDSQTSGTRFRFVGSEDLGNGLKVGMYYELQTSSAPSSSESPDLDRGRNADTAANVRQANVWFSGNWGKLAIGQQDGAMNGAVEVDLSGTDIAGIGATARGSFTSGLQWRSTVGGAQIGTLTEGNTYNSFDSFSRYDAIRYDSPALGPVTLAASIGNDQLWELGARLSTAVGGGQLGAALFYGQDTGSTGTRNADGSRKDPGVDARYGGSLS